MYTCLIVIIKKKIDLASCSDCQFLFYTIELSINGNELSSIRMECISFNSKSKITVNYCLKLAGISATPVPLISGTPILIFLYVTTPLVLTYISFC